VTAGRMTHSRHASRAMRRLASLALALRSPSVALRHIPKRGDSSKKA
jgi:hypothetical protein